MKSAAKFWQMIGRGTRLCPNLFAPGKDKEHFLFFDFCENFEFFNEFPEGILPTVPKSLSQQLFETKLEMETIKAVQSDEFWQEISLKQLEKVRINLRDLIKFIDTEQKKNVYTNFEDELDEQGVKEVFILPTYTSMKSYRDRMESFIRNNKDYLDIHKIQNNIQITHDELNLLEKLLFEGDLGTKADFRREYGEMPLGKFIRSLLGLDKSAANQLFSEFIQSGNLSADQITFINNIISFLTQNGTIDKAMLFEPPFTNINDQGITGVFDDVTVGKIVRIIDQVNDNAVRNFG